MSRYYIDFIRKLLPFKTCEKTFRSFFFLNQHIDLCFYKTVDIFNGFGFSLFFIFHKICFEIFYELNEILSCHK